MKPTAKKLLTFSLFLLFTMACRLYTCGGPSPYLTQDKQTIFCNSYTENLATDGYTCTIPCPDGIKVPIDFPTSAIEGQSIIYNLEYLQQQYCQAAPLPTEEPTQEPASAPTEEATEAPTEPPLLPYLTGTVTACDTYQRYINLPVRADAPAGPPAIVINGTTVNCGLANNNTILSCSYPEGLIFPFNIVATLNGQEVNNFSFDGAFCTSSAPQGPQGAQGEEGQPGLPGSLGQPGPSCDPIAEPNREICPLDCENPANQTLYPDLCG